MVSSQKLSQGVEFPKKYKKKLICFHSVKRIDLGFKILKLQVICYWQKIQIFDFSIFSMVFEYFLGKTLLKSCPNSHFQYFELDKGYIMQKSMKNHKKMKK